VRVAAVSPPSPSIALHLPPSPSIALHRPLSDISCFPWSLWWPSSRRFGHRRSDQTFIQNQTWSIGMITFS
jgi:hypothetical protein